MSKISESGFPALYRTLVAKPGQMPLFSARAQPVAKPVAEIIIELESEDGDECVECQEELYRGAEVAQTEAGVLCVDCLEDRCSL